MKMVKTILQVWLLSIIFAGIINLKGYGTDDNTLRIVCGAWVFISTFVIACSRFDRG